MKRLWLIYLFFTVSAFADSPITSTDIYKSYLDISAVNNAKESGVLNDYLAEQLLSDEITIDVKVAIINALSWDFDGKNNAEIFKSYLLEQYKKEKLDMSYLSDHELLCLGYLTVMDDYFHPNKALPYFSQVSGELKTSYTSSLIHSLVKAQTFLGQYEEWCKVWSIVDAVNNDNSLTMDMRLSAIIDVMEYIGPYEEYCKEVPPPKEKIYKDEKKFDGIGI